MSSQHYLSTREYAQKVGVSPSTISKWIRNGKLEGKKQNGKWVIPYDAAEASTPSATSKPTNTPPSTTAKADDSFFSVEKFSEMTYLTQLGVLKWLKEGRLKGIKAPSGEWSVSAGNLTDPNIKRLLRS